MHSTLSISHLVFEKKTERDHRLEVEADRANEYVVGRALWSYLRVQGSGGAEWKGLTQVMEVWPEHLGLLVLSLVLEH
jgi:hypothetical protein